MSIDRGYTRPRVAPSPAEIAARKRRIARAIKSGVLLKEAARHFKMDTRDIRSICAEMGVEPQKRGRGWL